MRDDAIEGEDGPLRALVESVLQSARVERLVAFTDLRGAHRDGLSYGHDAHESAPLRPGAVSVGSTVLLRQPERRCSRSACVGDMCTGVEQAPAMR